MDSYKARFYDSSGNPPDQVQVQVGGGKLIIVGTAFGIAFEDLDLQVGGHDGDRFKLVCDEQKVAIVSDDCGLLSAIANAAGATELGRRAADAERKIAKRGSHNAVYWAVIVSALCLLAIGGYLLLDPISAAIATQIDPSFEVKLGEMLAKTDKLDKKSERYKRVCRIGNQLVSHLDKSPYKFQFFVKNDRDVNACAYPGGILIVNSALIDKATEDEELAGVISHEVGHVIHRHTLKQALHNCGLITCLSIISSGVGGGADAEKLEEAFALAQKLESLNFSRSQETDADLTGLELEVKAGYKGDGLIQFFRRLEKQEMALGKGGAALFAVLSTHPMSAERAARIETELKRLREKYAK